MKIEVTDLSPVKKSLFVEVGADEVARESETVVRRLASRVRVPGFRPGKVPLDVVRARFAREIREDVREQLVSRLYREATAERGLKPLGDPALEQLSEPVDGAFSFRTSFEVLPELAPQGYRAVEVREPSSKVEEEEIARTIEELRQSQAKLVSEEGRSAAAGDLVIADVEGRPEEGEPFRRERTPIEVGAADNLPQFNEKLLGASAGAVAEFPVPYPKDHDNTLLAGKTVLFRVTVHEVKRREVPALDDDLARDLGDFESLEALRSRVRADLEERKRAESRMALRQALLDKILIENPVVLPEILVDEEIQQRLEDFVRAVLMQGVDPEKLKVDWKAIRERQEAPARKAVHARLVLDAVARAESISVEDEEVRARIRAEAERRGEPFEALRGALEKRGGLEALRDQLVREKTLDFLTSVANIQHEG